MTREGFIEKALKCHEEGEVDYSEVVYVNNKTKVKLIDSIYGEYWQTPSNHLKGHSHPSRRKSKIARTASLSQEEVIERFEKVHDGEGLDYSKVVYKNMHEKVCIIDPLYGEYWQEPIVHLKGCGHPMRGRKKTAMGNRYTTEEFVKLCKRIHPQYDYSLVDYKGSQEKVKVVCPKHGEFKALPDGLLQGKGCPRCGHHLSKAEDEIANKLKEVLGSDNVIQGDKKILDGKEIDILIPSKGIGIEFNGLRWHCDKFNKGSDYHLSKTLEANSKGISLIQIYEDEWNESKEKIFSLIFHKIGISCKPKIDGRKCNIVEKDNVISCIFNNQEVGRLTYRFIDDNSCFIESIGTDWNYRCRGVCGKMIAFLERKHTFNEMVFYVDKRWVCDVNNNIFTKLGFELIGDLPPTFDYTDGKIRSKDKLDYKIWNCGYAEYRKKRVV